MAFAPNDFIFIFYHHNKTSFGFGGKDQTQDLLFDDNKLYQLN